MTTVPFYLPAVMKGSIVEVAEQSNFDELSATVHLCADLSLGGDGCSSDQFVPLVDA